MDKQRMMDLLNERVAIRRIAIKEIERDVAAGNIDTPSSWPMIRSQQEVINELQYLLGWVGADK